MVRERKAEKSGVTKAAKGKGHSEKSKKCLIVIPAKAGIQT
jgi:hypothetical protein